MMPTNAPEHGSANTDPLAMLVASRGLRTVITIIAVLMVMIVLNALQHYLSHGTLTSPVLVPGLALMLTVLVLIQRGQMMPAFRLFLWGIALVALGAAFFVAGVRSPSLLILPLATMLAGWLLGPRQGFHMLAFITAGIAAIVWQQDLGHLPAIERDPLNWGIVYVGISAMGALFGTAMIRSVQEHFQRSVRLSKELADANAKLEARVAQRTAELSDTLARLRQMQDDLIQSEKLASLGTMVAGIAHELNTPIGNAVTVTSALADRVRELRVQAESGTLRKSELFGGLSSMSDMVAITDRSVQRAAALVTSFKQVAVDQISERRRAFDLWAVVEENLATLRPGLRNAPWVISNKVPTGITCDSYPGPLEQVLTNLIQNAIMHGFAGRDHGEIEISASSNGERVEIIVADNGAGMDTATAVRIFEPFFTTKLGKGGSGLGLAICFRIVTTILGGEIHAQSSAGTGTQFILNMPLRTPGKI